jgi:hypothetical protein
MIGVSSFVGVGGVANTARMATEKFATQPLHR